MPQARPSTPSAPTSYILRERLTRCQSLCAAGDAEAEMLRGHARICLEKIKSGTEDLVLDISEGL